MLYWIHQYDVVGLADGQFRSVSYQRFLSDLLNVLDRLGLDQVIAKIIREKLYVSLAVYKRFLMEIDALNPQVSINVQDRRVELNILRMK